MWISIGALVFDPCFVNVMLTRAGARDARCVRVCVWCVVRVRFIIKIDKQEGRAAVFMMPCWGVACRLPHARMPVCGANEKRLYDIYDECGACAWCGRGPTANLI
jgi:hypothetical protein